MNQNEKRMLLTSVSRPGRYAGGEYGQVIKDKASVKARFAFVFPDSYEIGMSNLGVRILYHCLNLHDDIWCERTYAPWVDMQEKMREQNVPLTGLESGDPKKSKSATGSPLSRAYRGIWFSTMASSISPQGANTRSHHTPSMRFMMA